MSIKHESLGWFQGAQDLLESFLTLFYVTHEPMKKHLSNISKTIPVKQQVKQFLSTFPNSYGIMSVMSAKLLAGLSIETLFKSCILIIDKNELEKNFQNKKGHKLNNMYLFIKKEWGISLSKKDEIYLSELEEYIIWKGKYPNSKKKNSKLESSPKLLSNKDFKQLKIIWDTFFAVLKEHNNIIELPYKVAKANANENKDDTTFFDLISIAVEKKIKTSANC